MRRPLLAVLLMLTQQGFSQELVLSHLRCEYRVDPAGIETPVPRLSWEILSGKRGVIQTAYRVLVSDDTISLKKNRGTIWDSKKVASDASISVPYRGSTLSPVKTYYWKLMVWDNYRDSSGWSKPSFWQTGLFTPADWKGAQWIAYEDLPDTSRMFPGDPGKKAGPFRDTLPILRKEFTVRGPLRKATAFICGLGHFEINVNGGKAGDHFLDPGWSLYNHEALYVPFDITTRLQKGVNAIGIMLGNGFYYIPAERYHKLTVAFGYPKVIGRIVLEYTDGSTEDIVTDLSWKVSAGPLLFSSTYGGEDYDARREQPGWDIPGFKGKGWRTPVTVSGPALLRAQQEEPLKVFEHFAPRRKVRLGSGAWVFDLGQNASGIPLIRVKGTRGRTVRIIPAELLERDSANQQATGKPCYFDYTLKGQGVESWHPRFMYYGFRYLQVEGAVPEGEPNPGGLPVIVGLEGWHTRNAAARAGDFSCSSELFRRTDTLIDWAIQSNMASVLTDCPHREKLGWLEEAHLMGSSVQYNYDIANLSRKIIHDMMDSQTPEGLVPEIAPELVRFREPFRDSPEWGSSAIIVPWYCYRWYGDMEILAESYPMMRRYNDYLGRMAKEQILYQGLGDWYDLGPANPGVSQLTPQGLTATAIWYYDLSILSKTAQLLGKPDEALEYDHLSVMVKKAFNDKFFNKTTNQYGTGSQTANAIAVFTGMVDPHNKDSVITNILKDLRKRNNALTSGDIGFRYLLKVLADEGRSDIVFDMNSRTDVPGYGYQLAHGATALTESWQALPFVSNNHFMLGHIMEWFYSSLAGIRQSDSSIAFHDIVLRPEPVGDLSRAQGKFHSPYGMISSRWKKDGHSFDWHISIPANTTTTIYLPAPAGAVITADGMTLQKRKDIRLISREKDRMILRSGSGDYYFHVQ